MRLVVLCAFLVCLFGLTVPVHASDVSLSVPVCAACGKPITGGIFQTKGKSYHTECFRCAYCDRPITGTYSEYKGKNYHTDCFTRHVALRCALCGDIIRGEYLQDFWGNSYCLRHEHDAPVCDSCGRFISDRTTGGGVRYDDGRYICNLCRPESVTDIDEILALVHEVAVHMKSAGMRVDYDGIRIHLIGRNEMQKLSGHHSNGLRGFTDYSEDFRVFGRSHDRHMDMYLLYGMPRMELISTIAHELGHVWQFNHGGFRNDRAWSEGSCNYAAYLVLSQYPGRESAFFRTSLTRDDDNVYGDGFRRVKTLAEARGTKTWLKYLASSTGFPAGY
ncbi:MAG TPA: LIM domain-containing protein [Candidatus Krumholzibacteria bacterium]|nr:LIM domain-containing protein [Candidatus Krumholzibacteria bacterium]